MKTKAMILLNNGKVAWRTFNQDGIAYLDSKKEQAYYLLPGQARQDKKMGIDYMVAVYHQDNPEPLDRQTPEGLTPRHLASLLGPKLSLALRQAMFPTPEGESWNIPRWVWFTCAGLLVLLFLLYREGYIG